MKAFGTIRNFLLTFLFATFCSSVYAQGTVHFSNIDTPAGVNAPVYESDGITKLSGSQFMAELLGGPSATSIASVATTSFLTGNGAGYFSGGVGGLQAINTVSPGSMAWVAVEVWNTSSGASFQQAKASGSPNSWWESSEFSVITGGYPTGVGPAPPAAMTGLGNSPVYLNAVPEPSCLALAGLGAIVVLWRIRRRDNWRAVFKSGGATSPDRARHLTRLPQRGS